MRSSFGLLSRLSAAIRPPKPVISDPPPEKKTDLVFAENIRLVIWDLDETYWHGTLTEGGHSYIDDHHNLVLALAQRGIISTICSKNDLSTIRAILQERGIWDHFVFPSIDWTPKAARVSALVREFGLRAPTILFVDDSPQNLRQVLEAVPGINVALPEVIPLLWTHPQLVGKPDPDLTRLKQYQCLEQRNAAQSDTDADPIDFLRSSEIVVSFEYDVEKHIDRAIELVNRTNQLNFTKERLPEEPDSARRALTDLLRNWRTTAALVSVKDKYGDYGFVGFFAMTEHIGQQWLQHFCFSCRTLNMYVEHFVYENIGRPNLTISGDVVSDVKNPDVHVDWIRVLPIGSNEDSSSTEIKRISRMFIRGGCDLMPLMHYLSLNCADIVGEFNGMKNWQVRRWDHSSFLAYSLFGISDEQLRAAEGLGYDRDDFITAMPLGDDSTPVYLLSFWVDADVPVYRHKATRVELPYYFVEGRWQDLISDTELTGRAELNDFQIERLGRLRTDWEFIGLLDGPQMLDRYRSFLRLIPRTSKVFMTLANEREPEHISSLDAPVDPHHHVYNLTLKELAAEFDNLTLIDVRALIGGREDLFDLSHLRREVYFRIYEEIMSHL